MERARETGEWTLRVYSWSAPTISLGRNQTARGRYDLDASGRADLASSAGQPAAGRFSTTARSPTASPRRRRARASSAIPIAGSTACCSHALHTLGVGASVATPAARAISPGMSAVLRRAGGRRADRRRTQAGRERAVADRRRAASARFDSRRRRPVDARRVGRRRQNPIAEPATLTEALGWRPSIDGRGRRRCAGPYAAAKIRRRAAGDRRRTSCPDRGARRPILRRCLDLASLTPGAPTSLRLCHNRTCAHRHLRCARGSAYVLAALHRRRKTRRAGGSGIGGTLIIAQRRRSRCSSFRRSSATQVGTLVQDMVFDQPRRDRRGPEHRRRQGLSRRGSPRAGRGRRIRCRSPSRSTRARDGTTASP